MGLKIFWTLNFLEPWYFWTYNFCGPNNFFRTKKNFKPENFFQTQKFFRLKKNLQTNKCFGPTFLFCPKFSSTPNFCLTQYFFGLGDFQTIKVNKQQGSNQGQKSLSFPWAWYSSAPAYYFETWVNSTESNISASTTLDLQKTMVVGQSSKLF